MERGFNRELEGVVTEAQTFGDPTFSENAQVRIRVADQKDYYIIPAPLRVDIGEFVQGKAYNPKTCKFNDKPAIHYTIDELRIFDKKGGNLRHTYTRSATLCEVKEPRDSGCRTL